MLEGFYPTLLFIAFSDDSISDNSDDYGILCVALCDSKTLYCYGKGFLTETPGFFMVDIKDVISHDKEGYLSYSMTVLDRDGYDDPRIKKENFPTNALSATLLQMWEDQNSC